MTAQTVDLTTPMAIHVIGVGGAGMRAIASVLAAMGHQVSGTDLKASPGLDRLRAEGIEVTVGHDGAHLGAVQLVTRSTAVPASNPEVLAAQERGIPVLSRADVLSAITGVRQTVSVAGTHGKTTTSSMLAVIMRVADLSPSFIIGGEVNEIGSGAVWSADDGWFIVEADESDGTFLALESAAAIVTSVEADHLSHYGSEAALTAAFGDFVEGVSGPTVVCLDDAGSAALDGREGVVTYGTDPRSDWVIGDYESHRSSATYSLTGPDGPAGAFELATPGLHNVRNAVAATVAAIAMGADLEAARGALARFGGVARRFQLRGQRDGVTFIDDYAHLPSEVEAALEAASAGDWDRVVCVFQPHRYTRTGELWQDFAASFDGASLVVITDIYAAGEIPMPGVNAKLIVDAVLDADGWRDLAYIPHREDLRVYLEARLRPGDLCLTLGAGDLTTLPDEMLLS
jgi:UDP-N-acetylmuramate--alanine ligase